MAARRSSSVCLYCQARQAALGRRRFHTSKRRLNTAVALRPEDDDFVVSKSLHHAEEKISNTRRGAVIREVNRSIEELRETALSFDALWKQRDLRLDVLRSLSNPWPEPPAGNIYRPKPYRLSIEESEAPIPHNVFRRKVKEAVGSKAMRAVLRAQLLRCAWPKDILRIVAVAMQSNELMQELKILTEPLMRALYRCRQNVSDPEVLRTLTIVITRYESVGIELNGHLYFMGLKFAARSRSLPAMKRYLRSVRERGLSMSSNIFRSVVAKFSIGYRGLGEIRNGRWKRKDLLQVINGFEDCKDLPPEQQYHFGTFLDRSDWQFLHGWVAILARCRQSQAVWEEWEMWKASDSWKNPRQLLIKNPRNKGMDSKTRGCLWFIEQALVSGDAEAAWKMFDESGVLISDLRSHARTRLLDQAEHANVWTQELRDEMIVKYDHDLTTIEQALGVKWVADDDEGQGHHELYMDQEEALDKLGEKRMDLDEDYGYPYETDPLVPQSERSLHDAEEGKATK